MYSRMESIRASQFFLYYMRPGTGICMQAERREGLPSHPPDEGRAHPTEGKGQDR
ncbi:hypothetical protein HMPREF1548_03301 [Clostridium sp. KLE 1755]|nr:hypothetical protein HMPREF1548_03301 [Clostridium sp. KLE 1755]